MLLGSHEGWAPVMEVGGAEEGSAIGYSAFASLKFLDGQERVRDRGQPLCFPVWGRRDFTTTGERLAFGSNSILLG